jgi:hypothetical protein
MRKTFVIFMTLLVLRCQELGAQSGGYSAAPATFQLLKDHDRFSPFFQPACFLGFGDLHRSAFQPASFQPASFDFQTPHGAVFCRFENFTRNRYPFWISIHAGGFTEQYNTN